LKNFRCQLFTLPTPGFSTRKLAFSLQELFKPLMLFSFAAGKGSALVIDVGQTMASVTPIVDGFVLRKGTLSASLKEQLFNLI
jgi:hypothetical protein